LQNPSQINGDNPKNVKCENNIIFRNKKREIGKDKINELVKTNISQTYTVA
jgi:hypothetical protein